MPKSKHSKLEPKHLRPALAPFFFFPTTSEIDVYSSLNQHPTARAVFPRHQCPCPIHPETALSRTASSLSQACSSDAAFLDGTQKHESVRLELTQELSDDVKCIDCFSSYVL